MRAERLTLWVVVRVVIRAEALSESRTSRGPGRVREVVEVLGAWEGGVVAARADIFFVCID